LATVPKPTETIIAADTTDDTAAVTYVGWEMEWEMGQANHVRRRPVPG